MERDEYISMYCVIDQRFREGGCICPSSNKWDKRALNLSECFAHHFHVTRHAVGSANDVSRWSFS